MISLFDILRGLVLLIAYYALLTSSHYHDFMCPVHPQWNPRANFICNKTDQYYCLFDENKPGFIEFCREEPWFDSAGFKIHFVGDIYRVPCEEDKYQPYKFWTNGSYPCRFQKSYCHEEGQVIADNGTEKSDRLCRCDYTRSYDYIVKPKDPCLCNPSKEDCSCYIKSCGTGYILTPEYQCVLTTEWKEKFKCPLIFDERKNEVDTILLFEIPTTKKAEITRIYPILVIMIFFAVIAVIVTGVVLFRYPEIQIVFDSLFKRNIRSEDLEEPKEKPLCSAGTLPSEQLPTQDLHQEMVTEILIDFQHFEKEQGKAKIKNFVETNVSKEILKAVKMEHCVIITGPSGCGKSCLAFYISFKLEETEGYEVMILTDPHDIIKYASADKRQLFILDDVFGKFSINENDMIWWSRQGSLVQNLMSRNVYLKLIMTCKTHIYNSINLDQVCIPFVNRSLISNSLQLTPEERRRIAKSYISGDEINQLSDDVLMLFPFFPSLCACFLSTPNEPLLQYFTTPYKFVNEELENFRKGSEIYYFALALLVIKNNEIKRDFFQEDYRHDDKLMIDLSKDIECSILPLKPKILASFIALKGSYTTETDSGLQFISDKIFNIVAYCTSKYCIRSLLKYGESSFLKSRIMFETLHAECPELTIFVPSYLEKAYFERLLMDLKVGFTSNVFTDMINEIPEFRMAFKDYLSKHLKPSDLTSSVDGTSVLHVVSELGYEEYVSFFIERNKGLINQDDNKGETPLHHASFYGKSKVVKLLIDNHAFIDKTNKDGKTPLDLACGCGHLTTVQILLQNKARIRQRTTDLKTALHDSCRNGDVKITELLLAFKAKVNLADKNGKTPLHIAASEGGLDIIKLLLNQNGIDVDCRDNNSKTPLLIACQEKHITAAEYLLNKAANPNISDIEGRLPLHYTCESNCQGLTKMLIDKEAGVNKADKKKNMPLHLAVSEGHTDVIQLLLNNNAEINCCDSFDRTPLILACQTENIMQKLFLENEAKINEFDANGKTERHHACERKCSEIAGLLLNHKADVNIKDKSKNTPFHIACEKGLIDVVRHMSSSVKDINQRNKDKMTSLMVACREGHREIVSYLITIGASVLSKSETSSNCLLEACRHNNKDIAEILIKNGALVNQPNRHGITPLIACCEKGYTELALFLLSKDADVNQKDVDGVPPFYIACREGHIDTMKALFESNANINETDEDGVSPLYRACKENRKEVVDLLLELNADVNTSCKNGMTPLHICCLDGHTNIIESLLKYNVTVNKQDNFGQTPIFKAASEGHTAAVQLLLNEGASLNIYDRFGISPLVIAERKGYTDIVDLMHQKDC